MKKVTHLLFPIVTFKRFSVTIPKKGHRNFHKGFAVSKWHCPKDLLIQVFSKIFPIVASPSGVGSSKSLKEMKTATILMVFFFQMSKRFFLGKSQDFNSLKMAMRRPKSNEKMSCHWKKTFYEVGFPFLTEIFVEDEYQQLRDGFHGTHFWPKGMGYTVISPSWLILCRRSEPIKSRNPKNYFYWKK